MRNIRIKTLALLIGVTTLVAAASVYAYYGTIPGVFQIYLRDPPTYSTDVQHVYLTIYRVELHRTQGDIWYQVGGNFFQTIDLVSAVNSSLFVTSQALPQGSYNMARLTLSYANVVLNQNGSISTYLLSVPPDLLNGMKIPLQHTLISKAGATIPVVIDLTLNNSDLHRSIMTLTSIQAGLME